MKFGRKCRIIVFISLILFTLPVFSQDKNFTDKPSSSDKRVASEEFRRGVQAYYRGTLTRPSFYSKKLFLICLTLSARE